MWTHSLDVCHWKSAAHSTGNSRHCRERQTMASFQAGLTASECVHQIRPCSRPHFIAFASPSTTAGLAATGPPELRRPISGAVAGPAQGEPGQYSRRFGPIDRSVGRSACALRSDRPEAIRRDCPGVAFKRQFGALLTQALGPDRGTPAWRWPASSRSGPLTLATPCAQVPGRYAGPSNFKSRVAHP
jgi:hypothetical protein